MLPRSTSEPLLPKASRRMLKSGPENRRLRSIWERKKAENAFSSIFNISSSALISTAMPSSMPEETRVP